MTGNGTAEQKNERVDRVDYAKGICIIMVVMMHSVLGVEAAAGQIGFMHLVVEFAKPFRMPYFFLLSGLFLPLVINRDWRTISTARSYISPISMCCGSRSSSAS